MKLPGFMMFPCYEETQRFFPLNFPLYRDSRRFMDEMFMLVVVMVVVVLRVVLTLLAV